MPTTQTERSGLSTSNSRGIRLVCSGVDNVCKSYGRLAIDITRTSAKNQRMIHIAPRQEEERVKSFLLYFERQSEGSQR